MKMYSDNNTAGEKCHEHETTRPRSFPARPRRKSVGRSTETFIQFRQLSSTDPTRTNHGRTIATHAPRINEERTTTASVGSTRAALTKKINLLRQGHKIALSSILITFLHIWLATDTGQRSISSISYDKIGSMNKKSSVEYIPKYQEGSVAIETRRTSFPRIILCDKPNNDASLLTKSFRLGPRNRNSTIANDGNVISRVQNGKTPTNNILQLNIDQSMCIPMHKWQTRSKPTCNVVHETDLVHNNANPLGSGYTRMVWRVSLTEEENSIKRGDANETLYFVLKTIAGTEGNFDASTLRMNFVDAVLAEQLTSSVYAVDIYGYCAQSVLNEYAECSLKRLIEEHKEKSKSLSSWEKLRYVADVAAGIADLHHINERTYVSAVYRDLKPDNIVVGKDGRLKISDFNDGELLLWNRTSNSQCGFRKPRGRSKFRSPEEAWETPLTEKVDVYALGGIIYYIVTEQEPYGGLAIRRMFNLVAKGIQPQLSPDYESSTDDAIIYLRKVMKMCHRYNPIERPNASDLVKGMEKLLANYSAVIARS